MNNQNQVQKQVFTNVDEYYQQLVEDLDKAASRISMMYYAFDHGVWAEKIVSVLVKKASDGVVVRLMVDGAGLFLEKVPHSWKNLSLIQYLRHHGVQVDIFRPVYFKLNRKNRLHMKICAIDELVVLVGGSNISDHYVAWDDANLRMIGNLGGRYHEVYDFVLGYCAGKTAEKDASWRPEPFHDFTALFTVPGNVSDIRKATLKLIRNARKRIVIRTWYFLPDEEIMAALCAKAEKGVQVFVMLSHKTRVRPVDWLNRPLCQRLVAAGGFVYRYTRKYMHAKLAWNDNGDVLIGSANMDAQSMFISFECSFLIHDPEMSHQLWYWFQQDTASCIEVLPENGRSPFGNPLVMAASSRLSTIF